MFKRFEKLAVVIATVVCVSGGLAHGQETDGNGVVLPAFTGTPRFCFLELPFAANRHEPVLIARDGNRLYFDHNANGDLTDDGDAYESKTDQQLHSDRDYQFEIDEIRLGDRVHKSFKLSINPLENYARGGPQIMEVLKKNPQANAWQIYAEIQDDRFQGQGLGGRVMVSAGFSDMEGVLQFGDTIDDAPTIRFCGTLEIRPFQKTSLRPGATKDIVLVVGSSGMGPGTFASIGYDGVIPETAFPRMMLETINAESSKTEITSQELKRRC